MVMDNGKGDRDIYCTWKKITEIKGLVWTMVTEL